MKIILTFTLLMIPGVMNSNVVTGYSGGEVTITCKYDSGYTTSEKYFCEGQWLSCTDYIRTDAKNRWVNSGRFSLYDNTISAVFTVKIRDLNVWDSGTYYCGVDRLMMDSQTEVNLNVIRDGDKADKSNPWRDTGLPPLDYDDRWPFAGTDVPSSSSTSDTTSVFSSPSVIIPVVAAVLSIIGGLLKLFCKYCCCKSD
ncbi:CMRF35-like molecule 8 isoform X2 [Chanodichthys erythropterus]|uniref:CMRF35-like molecule 8 isoform X2 n=1 Tax=Chanodichthys erythropterus TaxID=933992 RepID=UPI00351DDD9D